MYKEENILCSVIVPTFHDWRRTALCLMALKNQEADFSYEVLLVNNAPGDTPPSDLPTWPGLKILDEEKSGSYAARNKALRQARGQYVAFTDSDCIPNVDWLQKGVAHLERGCPRIAGRIDLFEEVKGQYLCTLYERAFTFTQANNVEKGVSVTANFFVTANLFHEHGPFNDELQSGGDFEWNRRLSETEIGIEYADDVVVQHPVRGSWPPLFEKMKRVNKGRMDKGALSGRDILKGLLPPFELLGELIQSKRIRPSEKIMAFFIAYWVGIIRARIVIRLLWKV